MLYLANTYRYNHILKMLHYEGIRTARPWLLNQRSTSCGTANSKHQIKYKPYMPPCALDHDHKNMTLKRPMSPHMFIYTPTMTAMTSIFQRITGIILTSYAYLLPAFHCERSGLRSTRNGIILTSYALLLAGGTLFLANGVETYVSVIQSLDLSRPSIFFIKLVLGAPFAFHYFNGIRFCAWNAGRWLSLKDVSRTAKKSWIAAAVVTLLFAFL